MLEPFENSDLFRWVLGTHQYRVHLHHPQPAFRSFHHNLEMVSNEMQQYESQQSCCQQLVEEKVWIGKRRIIPVSLVPPGFGLGLPQASDEVLDVADMLKVGLLRIELIEGTLRLSEVELGSESFVSLELANVGCVKRKRGALGRKSCFMGRRQQLLTD